MSEYDTLEGEKHLSELVDEYLFVNCDDGFDERDVKDLRHYYNLYGCDVLNSLINRLKVRGDEERARMVWSVLNAAYMYNRLYCPHFQNRLS